MDATRSLLLAPPLVLAWAALLVCLPTTPVRGGPKPDAFWQVDDVRPGMKGQGRTVMRGTKIESFDAEVLGETLKWLDKTGKGGKPFFLWFNSTAIHVWSHPNPKYVQMAVDEGRAEEDVARARMIEHDEHVGAILKKLDDLGVAKNTIVVYTTDNGYELLFWPDAGYAPFRGEKGTTWEGGLRIPCLIRWPGHIPPGTDANGIQSNEDLFVTLAAAAGLPNLKQDLLKGYAMNGRSYKVHLDGYDNLDYWTGKSEKSARREIFYYDETDLMAVRVDGWKMDIGVKHHGT